MKRAQKEKFTLQVYLGKDIVKKINKARGYTKTSTYLRAVIEQHFENNPDGKLKVICNGEPEP